MRLATLFHRGYRFLGFQQNTTGHFEKMISSVGGVAGILCVFFVSHEFVGAAGASLIIASMGATAVLLFSVPHGPLSQPWAVMAGHTSSAVIGVACCALIPDKYLAAAVAVGASIGAMHYLRCLHPPGGATALTAVIGGETIESLGFEYVITPVLINACVMVIVAIFVNFPFSSRRYPVALGHWFRAWKSKQSEDGRF